MSPHRTTVLVGSLTLVAVGTALLWRRAAFCKGLCPVGAVLHVYSRWAPVAVRPAEPSRCRACSQRGCTAVHARWRRMDWGNWVIQRKRYDAGCPVALYPPNMDAGECLLCLRCVRACPLGNLGVFWGERPAFRPLDGTRVVVLGALAGLLTVSLYRTWPSAWGALTPLDGPWAAGLWLGVAVPGGLLLGPAMLGSVRRAVGGRETAAPPTGERPAPRPSQAEATPWLQAGALLAAFSGPVLGAHAALALVKLNAKIAYVPYLLYDPTGAATYLAIHVGRTLPAPDLLVPLGILRWGAAACLGLGVLWGSREGWRRWRLGSSVFEAGLYATAFGVLSVGLGAALIHWLFSGPA